MTRIEVVKLPEFGGADRCPPLPDRMFRGRLDETVARMENAALDIVAKLAKTDTANRNASITSMIPRLSGGTSRVVTAYIQRRQLVLPGRRCGFGTKS